MPPFRPPAFLDTTDPRLAGIIHKSRPIFSTQFHPEAKGGPLDSAYLFDAYLESVARYRDAQRALAARDSRPGGPLLADVLGAERVGVVPTQGMANVAAAAARAQQAQQEGGQSAAAAAA